MDINDISIEAKVCLGRSLLSIEAYGLLQVGDIILLDQAIETSLPVLLANEPFFLATPGLFETHKAVKIDERIYT